VREVREEQAVREVREEQAVLEVREEQAVLEVQEGLAEQVLGALEKEVAQAAEVQSLLFLIQLLVQSLTILVQD
jgi:hypothetical protein